MKELIHIALKKNDINSLIHVGGHIGQEVNFYKSLKLDKVIYFEPIKEFSDEISRKINKLRNFFLHQCALGNQNLNKLIYIADKGKNDDTGSTSLLKPRESNITFSSSRIIEVKKYSSFNYSKIDLAILDTQGYELQVLEGFENKIFSFKFLIVEFSNFEGYLNQTIYKDLNKFLNLHNFSLLAQKKKVLKVLPNNKSGSVGDALYINNKLLTRSSILKSRIRFTMLNNLLVDFLHKYININFWILKLKNSFISM